MKYLYSVILLGILWMLPAVAGDPVEIGSAECRLRVTDGTAALIAPDGTPVMQLSGLKGSWAAFETDGGVAERISENQLRIDYRMRGAASTNVFLSSTYTLLDNRLTAAYNLTAPSGLKTGGTMILRKGLNQMGESHLIKAGVWQRNPGGGIAVETNDGVFRRYHSSGYSVLEHLGGNANWVSKHAQHISFKKIAADNRLHGETSFMIVPVNLCDDAAVAAFHRRPLSISLKTDHPFNLSTNAAITLTATVSNAQTSTLDNVTFRLSVLDFDGRIIGNLKQAISVRINGQKRLSLSIPPVTGVYFAEASVVWNGQEYFSRTTLGAVKPYDFKHRERSIFGIAAAFHIPSRKDVNALLKRMGVRWVRRGDTREKLPSIGAVANAHDNVKPNQWKDDPEKKQAELRKRLALCDERRNPCYEFCNEWNMSALHTGKLADVYVNDWLKPLAEIRKEGGFKVELLSMGLAGADTAFLKGIHANGGWPLLDGIAFHPGRGNVTPDYIGTGWTYLGAIRSMKKAVAELGDKPLWITEAYACTMPHSSWYDSMRRAAENTVLTYVIGLAEGMKAVMFYQLHDARWANCGGINTEDSEYYYGLLDRKGAIKPSLLAYCAVAEALDGAVFQRWLEFPGTQTKGILFDTPRGALSVLWDRSEGYRQAERKTDYVSPEPWIEHWRKRVPVSLNTTQDQVTVIDCVGRRESIRADDGKVKLSLTGAPVMVYGLGF